MDDVYTSIKPNFKHICATFETPVYAVTFHTPMSEQRGKAVISSALHYSKLHPNSAIECKTYYL